MKTFEIIAAMTTKVKDVLQNHADQPRQVQSLIF